MDPLLEYIDQLLTDIIVNILYSLAATLWYLEKITAFLIEFFIDENLWDLVTGALLDVLTNAFPAILNDLILGQTGLFYLALMLAGIFLILPALGSGARFVEAERVMIWGVFITVIFIGSATGYEMMYLLEDMRYASMETVVNAVSSSGSLSDIVSQPMQATPAEMSDWSFGLPGAFETTYYPDPIYQTEQMVILTAPLIGTWQFEFEVETVASRTDRTTQAYQGVAMAALTLAPAYILIIFALTFAALAAAALILLFIFLCAIPLGFFEFGAPILSGIVRQYSYIYVLSLVSIILPAVLLSTGTLAFTGAPTTDDMVVYLPILLIVAIASTYISKMATSALQGTLGVVSSSLKASVGAYAVYGGVPDSQEASQTFANVGQLAMLAATGGTSAAVVALGGLGSNAQGQPKPQKPPQKSQHVFSKSSSATAKPEARQPQPDPYAQRVAMKPDPAQQPDPGQPIELLPGGDDPSQPEATQKAQPTPVEPDPGQPEPIQKAQPTPVEVEPDQPELTPKTESSPVEPELVEPEPTQKPQPTPTDGDPGQPEATQKAQPTPVEPDPGQSETDQKAQPSSVEVELGQSETDQQPQPTPVEVEPDQPELTPKTESSPVEPEPGQPKTDPHPQPIPVETQPVEPEPTQKPQPTLVEVAPDPQPEPGQQSQQPEPRIRSFLDIWQDDNAPQQLAQQVMTAPPGPDALAMQTLANKLELDETSLEHIFEAVRDATRDGWAEGKQLTETKQPGVIQKIETEVENQIMPSPQGQGSSAPNIQELARLAVVVANASANKIAQPQPPALQATTLPSAALSTNLPSPISPATQLPTQVAKTPTPPKSASPTPTPKPPAPRSK